MPGSASFHSARKSLYAASALTRAASASAPCEVFACKAYARAKPRCASAPIGSFPATPGWSTIFWNSAADAFFQRHTIQKFHRDERVAGVLSDVMNRANVGMIQRGSGLGFALEAFKRIRVVRHIFRKEFQSDRAIEPGVLCFVHHAHATNAKLFNHAVVRDGAANQRGRVRH
jgi:hypothetical protein